MLETNDEIISIIKESMKQLGMNKKGRVTFSQIGFDCVGISNSNEPPTSNICPRWSITLYYPTGEPEPSKPISFEIITGVYQTENEIKGLVVGEIEKQLSK